MDATTFVIIAVIAAVMVAGVIFLAVFLIGAQREMSGRVAQIAETTAVSQAELRRVLDERLDGVSRRLGEGLEQSTARTAETLGDLKKHLNVLDTAQKNISELSGHVVGLQDILANKQARGAFGEIQLQDLVRSALPPSAYEFQVTLSNNRRADCVVKLPNPPGPIVVDAKFPLESYHALRTAQDDAAQTAASRKFSQDILKHVGDIADRYILPGETAESALTAETLGDLKKHLNVLDTAQKNISELSGHVVGLQDILANKQARGAFGEIQLQDLVQNALPPSACEFQVTLSNNRRADCVVKLPNPPGPIVVDAKFPLESYHALRTAQDDTAQTAASRKFTQDILKHVNDIAERYILPGETAESALMFLPSEAVYAELHANFPAALEQSYRRRVWIVSPTTLMATLNTVRAVLQDAQMREQAGVVQREVQALLQDVLRLDDRVAKLHRHFDQAGDDRRQIRISTEKVVKRGENIENIQIGEMEGDDDAPEDLVHQLPPRDREAG